MAWSMKKKAWALMPAYIDARYYDNAIYNFGDIDKQDGTAVGDYDFGELQDPTYRDDGVWNFEDEDTPEPEPALGDYDFGDLEAGIDPDSVIPDGFEIDLNVIPPYDPWDEQEKWDPDTKAVPDYDPDTDPEADDGVYNFGELPNDPGTADGDYNFNGTDPDTVIPDGTNIDFNDLPPHERWDTHNFNDLPLDPPHVHYDFYLNRDKNNFSVSKEYLKKISIDCIEDMLDSTDYQVFFGQNIPGNDPYLLVQFFYNEHTNKTFIQFCAHNYGRYTYVRPRELEQRLENKINSQFYYDTSIWPEIMNGSDKKVNGDNRRKITPYTVGYWKSLEGFYELLEDRAEIHHDIHNSYLPPDVLHKRFIDLIPLAEHISEKYNLLSDDENLSRERKSDYITRYYQLMKETHGQDEFKERLEELNNEYYPKIYNGDNIPDAYNEYWDTYKEYFGQELPRVEELSDRFIVTIRKNPTN